MIQLFVWNALSSKDTSNTPSFNDSSSIPILSTELPSYDPACLAAMAYLKILHLPYTLIPSNNPSLSETLQLPVALVRGTHLIHGLEALLFDEQRSLSSSSFSSSSNEVTSMAQWSLLEKTNILKLYALLTGPILNALIHERTRAFSTSTTTTTTTSSSSFSSFSFRFPFSLPLPRAWAQAYELRYQTCTSPSLSEITHWLNSISIPTVTSTTTTTSSSFSPSVLDALLYGYLAPLLTTSFHTAFPLSLRTYILELHTYFTSTQPLLTFNSNTISTSDSNLISNPTTSHPLSFSPSSLLSYCTTWIPTSGWFPRDPTWVVLRTSMHLIFGLGLWWGYQVCIHQPQHQMLLKTLNQLSSTSTSNENRSVPPSSSSIVFNSTASKSTLFPTMNKFNDEEKQGFNNETGTK